MLQCILMLYLDVYALLHTRQMYLLENSDRRIVMNFCFLSSSDGFCGLCEAAAAGPEAAAAEGAFNTGATIAFTAAGTGVNSGVGSVTQVGGGGTIIALTIVGGGGIAEVGCCGREIGGCVVAGLTFFFSFVFFAAGAPPFEFSPPQ